MLFRSRLVAAWRVGRLRAALPVLAGDLIARVDADLLAVGALGGLSDRELLGLLDRSAQGLVALHGHEVLVGWLVPAGGAGTTVTAASVALHDLAAGRAEGLADEDIVVRHPSVLALVPPRIGPLVELPPSVGIPPASPAGADPDPAALRREALRLRARWLQELTARAAWELGERLAARGIIAAAAEVRSFRRAELTEAVRTGVAASGAMSAAPSGAPPLPARFHLAADGSVVPAGPTGRRYRRSRHAGGTGAGGGRGSGRVHGGSGPPEAGAVLVVRTLDPTLAPLLPRLGGLVAETGSMLSHLAILAREFGVPTAVGVDDAVARFPAGATVVVDGTTGQVTLVDEHRSGAA